MQENKLILNGRELLRNDFSTTDTRRQHDSLPLLKQHHLAAFSIPHQEREMCEPGPDLQLV